MKFGDVKGIDVVSLDGATKLGTVEDVLLDSERRQALGFRVKAGGLFSGTKAVLLPDVQAIGADAMTIQDESKLNSENKVEALQGSLGRDGLVGSRVMTESGSDIGTVEDFDVSFPDGAITGYVLRSGLLDRMQHKEQLIPISLVKSIGDKMIVVTDEVVPA